MSISGNSSRHEYIKTQILDGVKGLKTYYVSALGDLIILSEDRTTSGGIGGWSVTDQKLSLLEWDFVNDTYLSERILFWGTSRADYSTTSADEYHDHKIDNLDFDYASNSLSWDEVVRDEEDNEWTADRRVLDEQITHRVFDTKQRQFV